MPVNSVSNVSFGARIKKEKEPKQKGQYFQYISQYHVNDALKMSKGREVEDGKFKAASAFTLLGGFVGAVTSGISYLKNTGNAIIFSEQHKQGLLDKTEEEAQAIISKLGKKTNIAKTGFLVSAGALLASVIIKNVNEAKADKTANERGFLSNKDFKKIKGAKNIYSVTEDMYNVHTR